MEYFIIVTHSLGPLVILAGCTEGLAFRVTGDTSGFSRASPSCSPQALRQKDVFLHIPQGAPPLESSFPVLRYNASQNESQWKAHFFPGKFQPYPQGCDWPCALFPKKDPARLCHDHTSLSTSGSDAGEAKVYMSSGSSLLSTTAPNTSYKEKHKTPEETQGPEKGQTAFIVEETLLSTMTTSISGTTLSRTSRVWGTQKPPT